MALFPDALGGVTVLTLNFSPTESITVTNFSADLDSQVRHHSTLLSCRVCFPDTLVYVVVPQPRQDFVVAAASQQQPGTSSSDWLKDRTVVLNSDTTLAPSSDGSVPNSMLAGAPKAAGEALVLPPATYAFSVFPKAQAPACM